MNLIFFKKISIYYVVLLTLIFSPIFVFAQNTETDDLDIYVTVEGCDNDSICEPSDGEGELWCPNDCADDDDDTEDATSTAPVLLSSGSIGQTGSQKSEEIIFSNFEVNTNFTSVNLSWDTNLPTVSILKLGYTNEYNLKSFAEYGYKTKHFFSISDLSPGVTYYYHITVATSDSKVSTIRGSFTTPTPAQTLLENVSNIKSVIEDGKVIVTWKNPSSNDFDYVRVMRKELNFPSGPQDGRLIYEGSAQTFVDENIFEGGKYYYTIFARYRTGDYSSGAYIYANYKTQEKLDEQFRDKEIIYNDDLFTIYDLIFIQKNKSIKITNDNFIVESNYPLEILLRKKEFFTPKENIILEIDVYDKDFKNTKQEVYIFEYDEYRGSYVVTVDNLIPNNTLIFKAKNGYRVESREISGVIEVRNMGVFESIKIKILRWLTDLLNSIIPMSSFILLLLIIILIWRRVSRAL